MPGNSQFIGKYKRKQQNVWKFRPRLRSVQLEGYEGKHYGKKEQEQPLLERSLLVDRGVPDRVRESDQRAEGASRAPQLTPSRKRWAAPAQRRMKLAPRRTTKRTKPKIQHSD